MAEGRVLSEFCLLSGLRIRTQKLGPSCRSAVQEGISHMTEEGQIVGVEE